MQATELSKERQKCTLGCDMLDYPLNGGIPCGSLTELVGESASGKTQLCLQLLLTVQLPVREGGLQGSSLYIYTENYCPIRRLQQLAKYHTAAARAKHRGGSKRSKVGTSNPVEKEGNHDRIEHPKEPSIADIHDEEDESTIRCGTGLDPCMNIFVQGLQTAEGLLRYLDRAEDLLSHPLRMPVRLLVVDSIAALFRADFDNAAEELTGRSYLFFKIASKLKKLAEDYDLAVVVTNQVADYFEPVESARRDPAPGPAPKELGSEILVTSGRRVIPALGISWAHCVNTRLFLSRGCNPNDNTLRWSMHVVFAPHLANAVRFFFIEERGLTGVFTGREAIDWSSAIAKRRVDASISYRRVLGGHVMVKEESSEEHFEQEVFSDEDVDQEVSSSEYMEHRVSFNEHGGKGVSSKRKFKDSDSDIAPLV